MPAELSGGQGQRIALARALVARPRVVFADEPTGSLDSVGADEVMELLVDAAKQQGTAVLVVTHEPRVSGFADLTVLIRDGVESVPGGRRRVRGRTRRLHARRYGRGSEPSMTVAAARYRRTSPTT